MCIICAIESGFRAIYTELGEKPNEDQIGAYVSGAFNTLTMLGVGYDVAVVPLMLDRLSHFMLDFDDLSKAEASVTDALKKCGFAP